MRIFYDLIQSIYSNSYIQYTIETETFKYNQHQRKPKQLVGGNFMEIKNKQDEKWVRIIIGNCATRVHGVTKPVKTINVTDASVDEVYNVITEAISKKKK